MIGELLAIIWALNLPYADPMRWSGEPLLEAVRRS